jgi:type III secretion system YscI/HrpB-like protein
MGPISPQSGAARAGRAEQAASEAAKSTPSKFDRLRADLNGQSTSAAQLPPKVTAVSDQQKQLLENDLRRKLETGKSPQEIFGADMKQLCTGITDLNRQVAAVPDTSAFAPLRQRLESIESDFNASTKLLKSPALDDPNKLLQMQMEVYKLTSNVEILSRTVSEAASGAKTILQTQV